MSHSHNTSRDMLWHLKVIVVCGVLLMVFALSERGADDRVATTEARFSDATEAGLQVIPASGGSVDPCPTAIEGGWDAYGRILYGNYANRRINFNGIYNCVTNNTSNVYFVPAGSNAETQSFINAAPGLNVSVF